MPPQQQQAQSDPWEEAAKQFKGAAPQQGGQPQSAPAANEDWKVWQTGGQAQTADPTLMDSIHMGQAAFDKAITPSLHSKDQGIIGNAGTGALNVLKGGLSLLSPAVHPLDTIKTAARMSPPGILLDSLRGKPTVGQEIGDSIAEHPIESAEQIGGQLMGGKLAASVPKMREFMRPTSSPDVVPPIEMHSERLGQAILPPGGLTPKLLESIRHEAPAVREYAQRTGNPLKTQAEGLKAAQGVGSEGVQHFIEHFLKPNGDVQVQLPNNVSPSLGHVSTLEQINQRISAINDLERATAGKSGGATMTAEQRLGLDNEAKFLRQKLYDNLSQRTGVAPDEIRNMREGYGGQYTVANALESARMGRLERIGKASQGQNPLHMPTSIADLPNRALTFLKGGEDAIANRQFSSRIRNFEPQAPVRPIPQPPTPQPYADPVPMSKEMMSRINASGEGVSTLPDRPIASLKEYLHNQKPLPSVNEVPSLKADAEAAEAFRKGQAEKYASSKAAREEAARDSASRLQEARNKQTILRRFGHQ